MREGKLMKAPIIKSLTIGVIVCVLTSIQTVNANMINITSTDQFNQITLHGDKPAIARFYGSWCGACKAMDKIYHTLADKYADQYVFLNVDVDKHGDLASAYGVKGVPEFLFFKDGQRVGDMVGQTSQDEFEQKIQTTF
jgi:thioredoxin 1